MRNRHPVRTITAEALVFPLYAGTQKLGVEKLARSSLREVSKRDIEKRNALIFDRFSLLKVLCLRGEELLAKHSFLQAKRALI